MAAHGLVGWCESRPTVVLGALAAVCLATFLATIPLPRVDGQLLSTDGFGYFVYLPSAVLDRDLDFANQDAALQPPGSALPPGRTATGLVANPWPAGPALLWLPFFLLAHALALTLSSVGVAVRLDGCGYWHQAFVIGANVAYGGAALLLTHQVARRWSQSGSALWATILVAFGGNLVYYLTAEPSMAHPTSAFVVSLFYAVWLRTRGGTGPARAAMLGGLVGLLALVRTQDVVLVVVPLAADFHGRLGSMRTGQVAARPRAMTREALVAAVAALMVYSPQIAVSQVVYGTWWIPPQLHAASWGDVPQLAWWSPHLLDVLFSARRGLFAWHPVFALAMLGAVPLWRRDRTMAAAVVVGVAAQAYVLGCWFDWWQGRAFGGRAFIGCLPLFATALAALVDSVRVAVAPRTRRLLAAGLGLLVAANFLLFVEYRFDLAGRDTPATWHDLGARRVTFALERLAGQTP